MNSSVEFNEVKNIFKTTLEYYNYSAPTINSLLTDDFINGLLNLQQQEPENNKLISILRNFSDEKNLSSLTELNTELKNELQKGGYVYKVLEYINSSWMENDFVEENTYRLMSAEVNDIDHVKVGISIIAVFFNFISKVAGTGQKIISSEITVPLEIARRLHNQFEAELNFSRNFEDQLKTISMRVRAQIETATITRSPLIIDLDGDGIETTKTGNGTHFDHDGNDFAESTGWVGKGDGLLVRDINGNGQIDDGTELFGNNSVLSSGEKAANGFEALKDLDSNNDGVFNNQDTAWNEVKVWKDVNGNGVVDDGELLTLEQAGITGINLDYQNTNTTDENGNQHKQTGTFIKADGTTGSIHDVWFGVDLMNTADKTEIDIPADIAALPNVIGFGNVHDLHTASARSFLGDAQHKKAFHKERLF